MNRILTAAVLSFISTAAFAEGDAAAGEKTFKKCKSCHMIANGDDVIFKGGRTGPNLYGIVGRAAATVEGFKYSKSLVAAGEAGLVWDEATLAEWMTDPKKFLRAHLDDGGAKSTMTYRLKKGADDVSAYLASIAPAPMAAEEAAEGEAAETTEPSN